MAEILAQGRYRGELGDNFDYGRHCSRTFARVVVDAS